MESENAQTWRTHLVTTTADFLDAVYAEYDAEQAKVAKKIRAKERTKRGHPRRDPAPDHNMLAQPMRTNLDNVVDKRTLGSGATTAVVQPEIHSTETPPASNIAMATADVSCSLEAVFPAVGAVATECSVLSATPLRHSQAASKSYYRPAGTMPQSSRSHYRLRPYTTMSSAAPIVFETRLLTHNSYPVDNDSPPSPSAPLILSFHATNVSEVPALATPPILGRPGRDSSNGLIQSGESFTTVGLGIELAESLSAPAGVPEVHITTLNADATRASEGSPVRVQACVNCLATIITSTDWERSRLEKRHKRCVACNHYELKRGKARPVHLEARRVLLNSPKRPNCTNCQGPIRQAHYSKLNSGWRICSACYQCERKYNELRPRNLKGDRSKKGST
ncbi:hypothetical protein C8R45DRAFT_1018056 [Mycena sanguinolenta]|nr:hypothetical protein C8R45DRAFT_1018056 [Mycena sanguinolenta]